MLKKLLVILGPTSTGKTDIGIGLAKKLNGEIISADSRQVYKYLDIGTGKLPSQNEKIKIKKQKDYWEMDGVKVWMYDVVLPKKRFNLYEYILKAEEKIQEISNSGKLPIIVGGTGLYIRSLIEGVSDLGIDENTGLRKELGNLDIEDIKQKINNLDSAFLFKLNNSERNNKRRLIRHYEKLVNPKTDKSFKGLQESFDILKIGLNADRKILTERIKQRVINRVNQGMIEESKDLLKEKILNYERMDELGLEYRYLAKYLKGEIKTQEEFIETLSLKIKQFAKRQETWFKKEKNVVWFDIIENAALQKLDNQVLDWYNSEKA